MFRLSTMRRYAAAIALSAATVTAAVLPPAATTSAAAGPLDVQGLPLTTGTLGESAQNANDTNVVVLFQKVEKFVNGHQWTYTVANASSVPAKNVVITKSFKIIQSGPPNMLATPMTQNLGTLAPYEVRWITISCGNGSPERYCAGTKLSAKTSTPESILGDNSASHNFQ